MNTPALKTQLLIARHGNTFKPGETPRRVGARTDLPLVELDRSRNIGHYLKAVFLPEKTFCSPLKRTRQTAVTALETAGLARSQIIIDDRFLEIDYGPDENQPEDSVISRIGKDAINTWNARAKVPSGWLVDPAQLISSWLDFGELLESQYLGKKILVVTSNGIARFSPALCQQAVGQDLNLGAALNINPGIACDQNLKVATGSLCLFEKEAGACNWTLKFWNEKPLTLLSI